VRVTRWTRPLLLLYVLVLVVALFSPSSDTQSGLVDDLARVLDPVLPASWLGFTRLEVLCNVAIIAPVSLLGSIAWPRSRWQDWTAYGFLAAIVVELLQGLVLPGRDASFSDIVANGSGALVGALIVRGWRRVRR